MFKRLYQASHVFIIITASGTVNYCIWYLTVNLALNLEAISIHFIDRVEENVNVFKLSLFKTLVNIFI
jgi:hypothetical protein